MGERVDVHSTNSHPGERMGYAKTRGTLAGVTLPLLVPITDVGPRGPRTIRAVLWKGFERDHRAKGEGPLSGALPIRAQPA